MVVILILAAVSLVLAFAVSTGGKGSNTKGGNARDRHF
jgi:hypothetical protein